MVPRDDERDKPDDDLPTETVAQEELDAMMEVAREEMPTERASAQQIQAIVDHARDEIPTVSVRRNELPDPAGDDEPTHSELDDEPTHSELDDEPTHSELDDEPTHSELDDLDELPTEIVARPLPPPPALAARALPADPPAGSLPLPLAPDELEDTRSIEIDGDGGDDDDLDETLEQQAELSMPPAPATAARAATPVPRNDTARVPRQGGRGVFIAGLMLLATGIAAVGWYFLGRDQPAPHRDQAAAPAPADAAATAPTVTSIADAATAADPGDPAPGEPFATSLARHQVDIDRCVRAHPADVGEGLTVTFVLPIAADGSAKRASIRPAQVARTGLGDCLREVARATRFAAQSKPVSVSIPLSVRPH